MSGMYRYSPLRWSQCTWRAAADARNKLNYHKEIASEYFVRWTPASRWEGVDSFSNIVVSRTGSLGAGNFKNGDFSLDLWHTDTVVHKHALSKFYTYNIYTAARGAGGRIAKREKEKSVCTPNLYHNVNCLRTFRGTRMYRLKNCPEQVKSIWPWVHILESIPTTSL